MTHKWRAVMRSKKFFIRLLIVIGLIGLLPTLIANLISYYTVTSRFKSEAISGNEKLISQTVTAVELLFHQVENTSRQLLYSPTMQSFQSFSLSEHYENYADTDAASDPVGFYNYYLMKQEALKYMASFRLNNDFIESVYFYDSIRNQVLDFENSMPLIQKPLEAFADREWQASIRDLNPMGAIILGTRNLDKGVQKKNVLTILIRTDYAQNAFAINIDADYLFNRALKKMESADHYYVVDAQNRIIMSDQRNTLYSIWPDHLSTGNLHILSSVANLDGSKQLVTAVQSTELPWMFVYTSDYDHILMGTETLKQTVILSALLLVFLMIFIAIVSTRKLYQPIQKLSSTLSAGTGTAPPETPWSDELQWIGGWMKSTLLERIELVEKVKDALPLYREQFKHSLLRHHGWTLDQLKEKMASLAIPLDMGGCLLFLIVIDGSMNEEKKVDEPFQAEVNMLNIKSHIQSFGCMGHPFVTVEVSSNQMAVIVSIERVKSHDLISHFRAIHAAMNTSACLSSIGVSRFSESLLDIPEAYAEAGEALEYRRMLGAGNLICIDDVALPLAIHFTYPKDKADIVCHYLKLGDSESTKKALHDFIRELASKQLQYEQLQSAFVHFLSEMLEVLISLGISPSEFAHENVYKSLLKRRTLPDMKDWLTEFVAGQCSIVADQLGNLDENHIKRLMGLVDQELVGEITLNSLAAQLGLSPAYVSRLFKQKTGQHFSEYLKQARMEKSKRLMAETDLQIQQIAELVGYNNAYYFIRLFKESMGMTPGEYKKRIRQS